VHAKIEDELSLDEMAESAGLSMPTQTQVIHSSNEPLFDIFGPLLQFLVTPAQSSQAFALMRGMVPPGVAIPLPSHADPEVLFVLEGELNVLQYEGDSSHWVTTRPGEIVCIPGDVRHALRNTSPATVTLLLTTTPNIYRFFRELGKPFHPDQPLGPPTPQDMQRLRDLASQHNYWMASPEENAAIGLSGF